MSAIVRLAAGLSLASPYHGRCREAHSTTVGRIFKEGCCAGECCRGGLIAARRACGCQPTRRARRYAVARAANGIGPAREVSIRRYGMKEFLSADGHDAPAFQPKLKISSLN